MSATVAMARIIDAPIHPEPLLDAVAADGHGAALLFLGTVRDHADGRPVSGMRYEAYVEMAEKVMDEIAREAAGRLEAGAVAVVHRIGTLDLREASVGIAVATPHRAPAYEVNRWIIEEIKKRLPVWKHEHYADGDAAWVEGTPLEADA
ncbi:MAG TPA: molybdenum cofactor biosynthesis protein MoaE [Longimicrobiales bacterium]|nr:molybdenum cofactor biosynthesis protein MoaE [Longimicrobiales bacterium]